MAPPYTRRAFLAGVTGSSLGLAGCASRGEVREATGPTFESVVSDVTVGSREVVIELASSDVSEVVLVGPDGTAFDSQRVQTGVRTVRFQLIELDPEIGSSSHYTPGTYEIVVVADDTEFTKELLIEPDIRLTDVRQYREGDAPVDLARIVFTVKNVGTGPTWVYGASFEDSPNYTANGDLNGTPSIPYLQSPTTADELIIGENESQDYIDWSRPLAFPTTENNCERHPQSFSMRFGVADGSATETILTPTCGGDEIELYLVDRSVYTQTEIEWEQLEQNS